MMATKQVKKIVNSLSCPICNKLFKTPKFLPCHHSSCEQCLEKMKEESRITCPQCRKEVIVPVGVKEFDNAFIINHMVDQLVLKCTVEDKPEVECDECFRDKPIKAFCTDCSSFLCHCCIDYHTYSKQFHDHHLVTLMESQSNKSLAISYSTAAPDPQQCQTIDVPKSTIIGKKVEFTIITRDNNGDHCFREGADQVNVQFEEVNNTILVSDNNDGVDVACFVPHQVGEVKVSVCVNGEHIKGSPYSVVVSRDYTSLCKPSKIVNNDGRMGRPWGIGFSRNGKWAVADNSNHCVYLYDGEDQLVRKMVTEGTIVVSFTVLEELHLMMKITCTLLMTTGYRSLLLMVTTCCSLASMELMMVKLYFLMVSQYTMVKFMLLTVITVTSQFFY